MSISTALFSSEGSIEDNPEFGLTENDFVPETGEPKFNRALTQNWQT